MAFGTILTFIHMLFFRINNLFTFICCFLLGAIIPDSVTVYFAELILIINLVWILNEETKSSNKVF